VRLNPTLNAPAGGAPKVPNQQGPGIVKVDGGTYSGSGFWSSGVISADPYLEYTLRIAKPGTYDYACLLHPPMVGKVVVSA
jgi:plastocyanin